MIGVIVRPFFYFCFYIWVILAHSLAHWWQTSAHCWQWLSLNMKHSVAQASQIVLHTLQIYLASEWSIVIVCTARLHTSAHSLSIFIQFARALASGSCKQELKHWLHTCKHLLQASIHTWYLVTDVWFVVMISSFIFYSNQLFYYSLKSNWLFNQAVKIIPAEITFASAAKKYITALMAGWAGPFEVQELKNRRATSLVIGRACCPAKLLLFPELCYVIICITQDPICFKGVMTQVWIR